MSAQRFFSMRFCCWPYQIVLWGGLLLAAGCQEAAAPSASPPAARGPAIELSASDFDADPFDAVLADRHSRRQFASSALELDEIEQLCWAGQGLNAHGSRTAPSAGGLYPLLLYVVQQSGTSRYNVDDHSLQPWLSGDRRADLQKASLNQESVGSAAVCMVVAYDESVTAAKYGGRAEQFCLIEVGHAAQNILLKATALKLAAAPIGGFEDDDVAKAIQVPPNETPAYVLAIGKPLEAQTQ